jgi:hypothetical protein
VPQKYFLPLHVKGLAVFLVYFALNNVMKHKTFDMVEVNIKGKVVPVLN